jgi:hypothetical protein
VRELRGDLDRVVGVEGAVAAPGVRDDADAVERLVRERPLEAAQAVEDEEHRARAGADELRARRDAAVEAARLLARAADDAGAVRAVADVQVRVRQVLDRLERREAGERVGVGQNLHVLDDVLAELEVGVRGVDAGVVDDDREVAPARDGQPRVARREPAVGAQAVDAGQRARLRVVVAQAVVEPDGAHRRGRGQGAHLPGRGDRGHHAEPVERDALRDAERAQRVEVRGPEALRRVERDDDGADLRVGGEAVQLRPERRPERGRRDVGGGDDSQQYDDRERGRDFSRHYFQIFSLKTGHEVRESVRPAAAPHPESAGGVVVSVDKIVKTD